MIITKSSPYTKDEIQKLREQIETLSMDLMRVALGLHQGSYKMVKRFSDEALMRCMEIRSTEVELYFAKILKNIALCLSSQPKARTAEDALMYCVLCKNYARKYLN